MLVLGIDGCRDGWLVVALRGGSFQSANFAPTVAEALDAHPVARVVAIDIPIGSEEKWFRSVDAEARKRLGSRGSTLFETPPLDVLRQPDFASAVSLYRKLTGKGLSQQSYALRTKILEVAPLADRDDRIIEVHPELSFSVLARGPIPASKKTWDGLMRRKLLLEQAGIHLPEALGKPPVESATTTSSMPPWPRGPPNVSDAAWRTTSEAPWGAAAGDRPPSGSKPRSGRTCDRERECPRTDEPFQRTRWILEPRTVDRARRWACTDRCAAVRGSLILGSGDSHPWSSTRQ